MGCHCAAASNDLFSEGRLTAVSRSDELDRGPVALREALPLLEVDALLLDLEQGFATSEGVFGVPAPDSLPARARVDPEGVECRHQRAEAAVSRLILPSSEDMLHCNGLWDR